MSRFVTAFKRFGKALILDKPEPTADIPLEDYTNSAKFWDLSKYMDYKLAERPSTSTSGSYTATTGSDADGLGSPRLRSLEIPLTARHILGVENENNLRRPRWSSGIVDPSPFEFELVCLLCLGYASECSCAQAKPTTVMPLSALAGISKPWGTFPTPTPLAQHIGNRMTHRAGGVAHSLWPLMCLGMFPVFNRWGVSVLRSHALETTATSRELLVRMAAPTKALPERPCGCGCQQVICLQVQGLYRGHPEAMTQATSVSYAMHDRIITVVRLSGNISYALMGCEKPFPIDARSEREFIFACSLGNQAAVLKGWPCPPGVGSVPPWAWDGVVSAKAVEVLGRGPAGIIDFRGVPLLKVSEHKEGHRLVLAAENFGAGTGFMVMDLEPMPVGSPPPFLEHRFAKRNTIRSGTLDKAVSSFLKSSRQAAPLVGGPPVPPTRRGRGGMNELGSWRDLKVVSERHGLAVVWGHQHTLLESPARPRRGRKCTGLCKTGNGTARAQAVYMIEAEAMAYTAAAQLAAREHKQLVCVNEDECLRCTVASAPRRSLVTGPLPKMTNFGL